VTGDLGYSISDVLIKPYPNREALVDRRKAEFNTRLSCLTWRQEQAVDSLYFSERNQSALFRATLK
jgi:hypothetical protein